MIDISALNENQQEAVKWDGGPLLVLAGPGSGKTGVLTCRIARILDESNGEHFRVLALTFTNKAAAEMRGRVEKLVPKALNRVRVTTFHSYAVELLQQHGSHINFRPDFQILSDNSDREALLDGVINELRKEFPFSIPEHFKATQLLPVITRMLEHCIQPENAEAYLKSSNVEVATPLSKVYTNYKSALCTANALDFPSLISETTYLLGKYPALARQIRKVFKHILVDEFQDTNMSQYQFMSQLVVPDPSTLFVVADDDQIIYQWNGASPERIEALRKDFNVSELQLPENYRCPPLVIELANALISKNLSRSAGKKPLKAVKTGYSDDVLRIFKFNDVEDESTWIANDISSRTKEARAKCAVLARTKKLIDLAVEKLNAAGVHTFISARKDEFKSAPLRMLHSILRMTNSKEDRQSLTKLCKAFYELEGIGIEPAQVISNSSADGEELLRVWLYEVQKRDVLEDDTAKLLTEGIKPLLDSLDFSLFAKNLFLWANRRQANLQNGDSVFSEYEEECNVWGQLYFDISKKFEGEKISLHQFLHELDLSSKTPMKVPDAIPCFTIHASKGMEFGHVYLMGLVEDQLPSWAATKKGEGSIEMQEERRNCFVAITRAQESLTLTFASKVFGWQKEPSRFLSEMGITV